MLRASQINHHWRRFAHSCLSVVAVLVLTPNVEAWESKASKVCRLSLTYAVKNIQRNSDFQLSHLKHLIQDLPAKTQHLFSAALANDGTILSAVDENALRNFSNKTLARLSKKQRAALYPLLKWDDSIIERAEKMAKSNRRDNFATYGAIGAASLIISHKLIKVGIELVVGLGAIANQYIEYAEYSEEEAEKKKKIREESFGEFLNEDPSYFISELKVTKGLKELPEQITLKGLRFQKNTSFKGEDGGSITQFSLVDGNSKIKHLIVHEDIVKNVHDGFQIGMVTEDNNWMIIRYDENAKATNYFHQGKELEFEGKFTPRIFIEDHSLNVEELALMSEDKSAYMSALPPLAAPKSREESAFDKKYKEHIQRSTIVAVIDTGIDYTRSDLISAAVFNSKEIPNDKIDNDQNGYVDDYLGYDVHNDVGATHSWPNSYHGSLVSEVILNGSKQVKVLPVKVNFGTFSDKTLSQFTNAIDYIKNWNKHNPQNPVRVVNTSFSSSDPDQLKDLRRLIRSNPELIIVASSGNENEGKKDNHAYPASFDLENVISVGSIDANGIMSEFSGDGPNVDYVSVGTKVSLKRANGKTDLFNGTSYSAPDIALLVAEILTLRPKLSAKDIKEILDQSIVISSPRLNTRTGGIIDKDLAYEKALKYPK